MTTKQALFIQNIVHYCEDIIEGKRQPSYREKEHTKEYYRETAENLRRIIREDGQVSQIIGAAMENRVLGQYNIEELNCFL